MSVAELKERAAELTEDERLELQAWLIHLNRKDDPEYKAELSRRFVEMDAGKKVTKQDIKRLHEELIAKGQ